MLIIYYKSIGIITVGLFLRIRKAKWQTMIELFLEKKFEKVLEMLIEDVEFK